MNPTPVRKLFTYLLAATLSGAVPGCAPAPERQLNWYVFDEPSGAFAEAAGRCSTDDLPIVLRPLPSDADQQREQLARRLAARDTDIDIIGMDVIWTAEFAAAGWIVPLPDTLAESLATDRLEAALQSARFEGRLWAAPFTTNAQLLWYRSDRVQQPPQTWDQMIETAQALGKLGTIQLQGQRYEGLTVFFTSLLASAGGEVLDDEGRVALPGEPTQRALALMRRLAQSPVTDANLANSREDHARLAFERGDSSFMLNYTYVWPSAHANAPRVAARMQWARWPAVVAGKPSRVTLGGINLAVSSYSRHPHQALRAIACLTGRENQRVAALRGGLPPTRESLYRDPRVREVFPFADTLLATLRHAVQRARTPYYSDLSLAIQRTLHPMHAIVPTRDSHRLREKLQRALASEGLF